MSSNTRFGRQQLKIMKVLWEKGEATAREITDAMNQTEPIAHKPEKVRQRATRDLVDRIFDGSPGGLVAYLLQHERIPRKELERIQRLIDETGKGPKRK